MSKDQKNICLYCKWWLEFSKSDKGKDGGMCRRYAPKGMVVIEASWKTSDPDWPWTYEDDWCGEFENRRDDTEQDHE